jgi:hypothetical protein
MVTAVAFPKRHADRERLRAILLPLPALYPDGIERPCAKCGMVLDVGPRLAAHGYDVLLCPWHLAELAPGSAFTVSLGNPDSKFEDPHE